MKQTPRQRHVAEESGKRRAMPLHDGMVLESSGAPSGKIAFGRTKNTYIHICMYTSESRNRI